MKEREHLGGPEFDGGILLKWRFGLVVYSVLMKKSEGKRTLSGPRVCWEDIIKVAIWSRCVE